MSVLFICLENSSGITENFFITEIITAINLWKQLLHLRYKVT